MALKIPLPKLQANPLTMFLKNPLELAYELEIPELEKNMLALRQAYYNDQSLVSDQIYDQLEIILAQRHPKSKILTSVGAEVTGQVGNLAHLVHTSQAGQAGQASFEHDKEKIKLPFWMGSMDKVKPDSKLLENWLQKFAGPYQISHKLDGISALLIMENSTTAKLYTRGNGSVGQDISHLLSYIQIKPFPKSHKGNSLQSTTTTPTPQILAVRGEIILSKKKWQKYQTDNSNPRNMVAGLINAKHPEISTLQDLDFVAYELLAAESGSTSFKASDQFRMLETHGFRVAKCQSMTELNSQTLSQLLDQEKANSEYQIDGLIITQDQIHTRNLSGNPKYSVAFKKNDEGTSTKVVQVIWSSSRHGYLKPRLEIEPVVITDEEGGSVNVKYCTAFNAKFIQDNQIGPGAEIKIIRSGDVIPYITEVLKPAPAGAQMPDPSLNFVWNSTGIDLQLIETETSDEVLLESLIFFFKSMETKHVSQATIQKLIASGKKTVASILNTELKELSELPGFGQKSAERARESLDGVLKNVDQSKLMAASGAFGRGMGSRKMRSILAVYPDFGQWRCSWQATGNQFDTPNPNLIQQPDFQAMVNKIIDIAGFQEKTAHKVVYNLPKYQAFLKTLPVIEWMPLEQVKVPSPALGVPIPNFGQIKVPGANAGPGTGPVFAPVPKAGPASIWQGQKVVFSGFRDKAFEKLIESQGGEISSAVTGRTTIVIVKNADEQTTKITKAQELGIPIKLRSDYE